MPANEPHPVGRRLTVKRPFPHRSVLWVPLLAVLLTSGAASASPNPLSPSPAVPAAPFVAHVVIRGEAVAPAYRDHLETRGLALPPGAAAWRERAKKDARWLARREAEAQAALRPVDEAAGRLGLVVIDRYSATTLGLQVQGSRAAMDQLAQRTDVRAIQAAPVARPALSVSSHDVGAERVLATHGLDGAGTVIAVVDTGLDYTHAAFEGPGEVGAWQAATEAVEAISETWLGEALFPSAKVIAGHDFAGAWYAVPEDCRSADPDTCLPRPDPDPIEEPTERVNGPSASGHGTHVAAIAAGTGPSATQRGVAPAARLAALKIFGGPAAGSALVPSALEWILRVNLGLPTPGIAPPQVDVVNLSLGELYPGPGLALLDEQVAELLAVGVTVVAAAGNDGGRPFTILAPGSSAGALSVASVENAPIRTDVLVAEPTEERVSPGVAAAFAPPLSDSGRLSGPLVVVDDPCAAPEAPPGAIALAAQGGCRPEEIARDLSAKGVAAILLEAPGRTPPLRLTGETAGVSRPVLAVAASDGARWRTAIAAGEALTVTLDPARQQSARGPSDFAARGPAANGALKPDIAAPGRRISAARSGSGRATRSISGSSMSAPHAAGAAALLRQHAQQEELPLRAPDIAALLKSTARTPDGPPAPGPGEAESRPMRVGTGLLAIDRAVASRLLIQAGDLAELDLGAVALDGPAGEHEVLTRTIRVRDLSGAERQIRISTELDQDLGGAVTLDGPSKDVVLPNGGSVSIPITITLRPGLLPAPEALRAERIDVADLVAREAFGRVRISPLATDGSPQAVEPSHAVPVYVMATRASRIQWEVGQGDGGPAAAALSLRNSGPITGTATLLRDAAVSPQGWRVGAGWADTGGDAALQIVAARAAPMVADWLAYPAAWLDLDADGRPEWRVDLVELPVRLGGEAYPTRTTAQLLLRAIGPEGESAGSTLSIPAAVAIHSQLLRLDLPLAALGLQEPVPAALWLSPARWTPPLPDEPPGMPPSGAAYLRLSVQDHGKTVSLSPGESLDLPALSDPHGRFLLSMPDNAQDRTWAQSAWVGTRPIYLPRATLSR